MKYLVISLLMLQAFSASAQIWVRGHKVSSIQVSTSTNGFARYDIFTESGKWVTGDERCPEPTYAMITEERAGARDVFALAMAAQAQGRKVTIVGDCGYHPAYFDIHRIIIGKSD